MAYRKPRRVRGRAGRRVSLRRKRLPGRLRSRSHAKLSASPKRCGYRL